MRAGWIATAATVFCVGLVPLGGQGTGPCNRECLTGIAEQYLTALAAKDPKRASLAPTVKFTDNGQELPIGDGFWNSASGRGTYTFHIADQVLGSIVTLTTMREGTEKPVPVLLAVRLKIDGNRRITEVEQIVARGENMPGAVKNLETMGAPRPAFLRSTPPADRVSRAELVRVANMYFSGMQLNDGKGKYPFGDDCDRIENGGKATNSPGRGGPRPDTKTATSYSSMWSCREQFESGLLHFVSRIRDRRYVAVDEERGVVAAFVFFDHDAGQSRYFQTPDGRKVVGGPTEPWTWHIAEVFKVEKGLLHEIEAILTRAPYGMGSGWTDRKTALSDRIQFEK
jgi:hypothetical protein